MKNWPVMLIPSVILIGTALYVGPRTVDVTPDPNDDIVPLYTPPSFIADPVVSTRGMTWAVSRVEFAAGEVQVSCIDCDAYHGDTDCSVPLPVLCVSEQAHLEPISRPARQNAQDWFPGRVGLTRPRAGGAFEGITAVDAWCAAELGDGYRAASFHERGGGHFWARGTLESEQRFWVHIRDQNANCWQR